MKQYYYRNLVSYCFHFSKRQMYYFSLSYSSYSNSYSLNNSLQVGTNSYVDFLGKNGTIEIIPIRTKTQGLCYKLTPSEPPNYMNIFIGSSSQSKDKLEKINLMIAANNTWQGIVGNKWPYSKGLKISKSLYLTFQSYVIKSPP